MFSAETPSEQISEQSRTESSSDLGSTKTNRSTSQEIERKQTKLQMAWDQEQQTRDALLKLNQAAKEVQHLKLCTNAFQSHTNRGLQIDTNYKTMQRVAEKKK